MKASKCINFVKEDSLKPIYYIEEYSKEIEAHREALVDFLYMYLFRVKMVNRTLKRSLSIRISL